jgi:predicted nucleic acid-binding protein
MSVFVDSSAFVAVLEEDDQDHVAARAEWERLVAAGEDLRTSNYVVVETIAVLQRHSGVEPVRALLLRALSPVAVQWVTQELHEAGLRGYLVANRRDLSLVDCVSFELMRELRIDTAFAFDPHFADQGFDCLPAPQ